MILHSNGKHLASQLSHPYIPDAQDTGHASPAAENPLGYKLDGWTKRLSVGRELPAKHMHQGTNFSFLWLWSSSSFFCFSENHYYSPKQPYQLFLRVIHTQLFTYWLFARAGSFVKSSASLHSSCHPKFTSSAPIHLSQHICSYLLALHTQDCPSNHHMVAIYISFPFSAEQFPQRWRSPS